jgi:DNA mismatch repair protein MutL
MPSQRLLTPVLIEAGEALTTALARVEALLRRVGMEAEAFGIDTVRVVALPPELPAEAAEGMVMEFLERATALDADPQTVAEGLEEELAAALACRAAVKINHPLAPEEQRALLRDLEAADNPYRCPHGRPILLRLSQEEMERRLGRRS